MTYRGTTSSDKELTAFIKAVVNAENNALINGIPSPDLPLNNGKSLEGCRQSNDDLIVENAAKEIQLRAVYYSCKCCNNEEWAHSYDCTKNTQGNISSTWNEYDFSRGNPSNQGSVTCNLENNYPVIYPMQMDLQAQKLPYRPIYITSGESDEDILIIDEFPPSYHAKHSNPQPFCPQRRTHSPINTNHGIDYSKDGFNTEIKSVDKHGCELIENWFNSLPIESNEIRLTTREDCLHESGANHSTMFPDYSNMSNASGNDCSRNIEMMFTRVNDKTSVRPRPSPRSRPYSVEKDCCSLTENTKRGSLFKADTRIEKLRTDVLNIYQRYNQDERSVVSSVPEPQLAADSLYSEYERRVELRPNTMYNPRLEQSGDAFNSFLQVKPTNCLSRSPVNQNGKMQADYGQKLTHFDLPVIKQSTMMSRFNCQNNENRQRQTIKMQGFMDASQCKTTSMIDQPTTLSQFNRAVIQPWKMYTSGIDQTSSVLSKRKNCETNKATAGGKSIERGTCWRKRKGEVSGEPSSVISPATVRPGTAQCNVKEELGYLDSNGHRNQTLSHAIDGSFQQMKSHVASGITGNLITTCDTMPVHDALLIPQLKRSSQNITTRDGINSARYKHIQVSARDSQQEKSPVYVNAAKSIDNEVKDILASQRNFPGWLKPAPQMKMPKKFAKERESQESCKQPVIGEQRRASIVQHCILGNQTNADISRIERGLSTTEGSANHQVISKDTRSLPQTLNHAKVTDQGEDTKQVLATSDRCDHKKQSTRDKFIRSTRMFLGRTSNVNVSQSHDRTVSMEKHIPENETTPKSPTICGVSTCDKTFPSNVRSQEKKSSHSEDKDSNGKNLDFGGTVNSTQENAGCQTKGGVGEISHSKTQIEKLTKVKIPRKIRRCTPRNYICQFAGCSKTYCMRSHLVCHQRIHTGQRPYACTWRGCSMKFRRSDELSRHYRSHTGDKPYKCWYCVRAFSRSDHRKSHIRKVHNCDELGSPYVIKGALHLLMGL